MGIARHLVCILIGNDEILEVHIHAYYSLIIDRLVIARNEIMHRHISVRYLLLRR